MDPSALADFQATGFYQAFSLIFLSELGDKTFFIAGLLSMKTSRLVSFVGSLAALAVMTLISVAIGQVFHAVPAGLTNGLPLDDVVAVAAFTFFGLQTLRDALNSDPDNSSIDSELSDATDEVNASKTLTETTAWAQILSTFGLVFAAEFGDKSFLATIALAAAQNPFAVTSGAIAGHAAATAIAVTGGSYISRYISERVVGVISGSLFLVFALTTLLGLLGAL
ncbi:hypothetical protein TeGR_g11937 [Tetraparma gracilis]|uniref:GDT1 family protein n=1 Tax=Tetraparma gracilis TaxID=2962635 RepID=A0ABQ6MZY8_9STRA|nr:hypothetical protein TeGR_g11937 [Tetraparma gracilis]